MTRAALLVLVALGCAGLGTLDTVLAWAGAAVVLLALAGGWLGGLRTALGVASLPLVIVGVAVAARSGVHEQPLGGVLLLLLLQRLLGQPSDHDRRAVGMLSGLMLAFASSSADSATLLWLVVAWGLVLPVALVEGRPGWGILGLSGGLTTLALAGFLAVPRLALGPGADARTGFSEQVSIGELGALRDDPSERLRLRVDRWVAGPIYLRGAALDHFDGRRWARSDSPLRRRAAGPLGPRPEAAVRVDVRGELGGVLLSAGRVLAIQTAEGVVLEDAQGGLHTEASADGWSLWARPPFGPSFAALGALTPLAQPERWLGLPPLDPRVPALADQLAGDAGPVRSARRLRDYLRGSFTYTRSPGDLGLDAPLAAFLFERRSGHCGYYASALAVLLRTRGVPSRVVTGFVANAPEPDGDWVVRASDAHAWVEAWLPQRGWVVLDATPGPAGAVLADAPALVPAASWSLWGVVRDYDRGVQLGAITTAGTRLQGALGVPVKRRPWLGWILLAALSGALGGGLAGLGRQLLRRATGEAGVRVVSRVGRLHRRARRALARKGWRVPAALPPVAAARWLIQRSPGPQAEALEQLAWLYYRVRLGAEPEAELVAEATSLAQQVSRIGPPPG